MPRPTSRLLDVAAPDHMFNAIFAFPWPIKWPAVYSARMPRRKYATRTMAEIVGTSQALPLLVIDIATAYRTLSTNHQPL